MASKEHTTRSEALTYLSFELKEHLIWLNRILTSSSKCSCLVLTRRFLSKLDLNMSLNIRYGIVINLFRCQLLEKFI
uniref:Uncharacterized protein n=1 Tax=Rhizophora mucronata TaxID=61149 RepID=A0A2P2NIV6_RHIMU